MKNFNGLPSENSVCSERKLIPSSTLFKVPSFTKYSLLYAVNRDFTFLVVSLSIPKIKFLTPLAPTE